MYILETTTNKKLVRVRYKIKNKGFVATLVFIVIIEGCLYGGLGYQAVWSVVGCLANGNGGHYVSFQAYQRTAWHNTLRPQYSCELCLQI